MRQDRTLWSRFCRDKRAVVGLVLLVIEVLVVCFVPLLFDLEPNLTDRVAGFWATPSAEHWLGTDDIGRDIFARLLYGGQISLLVGVSAAALSVVLGVPLGLLAGYRGGAWAFWIMRAVDVFQSFPSIVLVLCLVSLTGPSVFNLILVLGVLGWTDIARLVYGNTLSVRSQEYVLAVQALGGSTSTILRRNVLPNVVAPVWPAVAQRVGKAILSESSLSFLGVGIRTPQASWGNLVQYATGIVTFTSRPWVWLPAGACIVVTVLSLQWMGEGLRQALDPRSGT